MDKVMKKNKIEIAQDFVASGDLEAALEILIKIDIDLLHWAELCAIARLYHKMGNFMESEKIFKVAAKKEKSSCVPLNGLGILYLEMKKFNEVIETIPVDSLIELDSTSFLILGLAYDSLDDEEKSEFFLREAIRIDDSNLDALFNLSLILREKDLKESTFYLEKCLKIDDKFVLGLREIGWNYRLLDDLDKGEKFLKEAIKLNPNSKYSYLYLGNLYLAKDDSVKAKENFRKSLDLDPEDEDIRALVSDFL